MKTKKKLKKINKMKLYLIEHNKKEQSYSVLVEADKLYIMTRVENGTFYIRKAWLEDNELISRDWTTSYEITTDYLQKLQTLNTIPKLEDFFIKKNLPIKK
jgi:hypothetical protein